MDQRISNIVSMLNNNESDFAQLILELHNGFQRLLELAPHYDFSPDAPANGLRSFAKIIHKYIEIVDEDLEQENTISKDVMYTGYLLVHVLRLILQLDVKRSDGIRSEEFLNENHAVDASICSSILAVPPDSVLSMMRMGNFWLSKSLKMQHKLFSRLVAVYVLSSSDFLKLLDPRSVQKTYAKFSLSADATQVHKIWSFYGIRMNRPVISMVNGLKPKIRRNIRVPRQKEWIVDERSSSFKDMILKQDLEMKQDKVKCLFLQNSNFGSSPRDSLVLHLHGGGYIAIKPKCHEMYLRRWASKLKGVPILSIDYSLSPESRYPVAIQEILDVYLFLMSGDSEVLSLIGFHPKNIVLFGDSAGSALSVSLMNVLSHLNHLLRKSNNNQLDEKRRIPYPKALFLPYPHANPTVHHLNPSRLFMAFDPVLPIGCMFSLTEAYNPTTLQTSDDLKDKSSIEEFENKKKGKKKSVAWYRRSGNAVEKRMREMIESHDSLGPFFNPLAGDYQDFRGIPLFIQVGEFDPLLDDAIALAKKWTGNYYPLGSTYF